MSGLIQPAQISINAWPNGRTEKRKCLGLDPEGDERTWLVDMSKPSALGNLKGFATAVLRELIASAENKSLDLQPFADAGGEMGQHFEAAVKGLGSAQIETSMVTAFADYEAFEYVVGDMFEESPPIGARLYLRTWQTETRSGNNFTIHDWKPCDEHALGRVRSVRAANNQPAPPTE